MIGMLFKFGNEVVEVRVHDGNPYFRSSASGTQFVPLEGLRLNQRGVFKEHPDLIDDEDWAGKAISRLKEKLDGMDGDEDIIEYIRDELKKFGYVPFAMQKQGHRIKRL